MTAFGAAARVLGEVGGDALTFAGELDLPVADLARVHRDGLAALLV
jgi:phosphoribosylformylglycinamidine synthase